MMMVMMVMCVDYLFLLSFKFVCVILVLASYRFKCGCV